MATDPNTIWEIIGQYRSNGRQIRYELELRGNDLPVSESKTRYMGSATVIVQNGPQQVPMHIDFEIKAHDIATAFERFEESANEAAEVEVQKRMEAARAEASPIIRPGR